MATWSRRLQLRNTSCLGRAQQNPRGLAVTHDKATPMAATVLLVVPLSLLDNPNSFSPSLRCFYPFLATTCSFWQCSSFYRCQDDHDAVLTATSLTTSLARLPGYTPQHTTSFHRKLCPLRHIWSQRCCCVIWPASCDIAEHTTEYLVGASSGSDLRGRNW